MSRCQFKDDKGVQGAKYKRHVFVEGVCRRCKRTPFVKTKKKL